MSEGSRAPTVVPLASDASTRVEDFTGRTDLSWVVELLTERRDEILSRWLDAATDQPFHRRRSERAVADHIPALFDALVQLLARDRARGVDPGAPLEDPGVLAAAENHARVRFRQGFSAPDVATEFRLLRQEIGRALRLYVSDRSPTTDVVGAELLLHDALDGAVFLALAALNQHEDERRKTEAALRESEERFRLLVERVEDYAIYTLTPDGRVASWNVGAERILGRAAENALELPFPSTFTPDDVAARAPEGLLVQAATDGRVTEERERLRADGSRFLADSVLTALHDQDGALVGYAEVLRDVTERRRAEAEKASASSEREAFFAMLGHDLKSPLVSATAISQLLRYQSARGVVDPEQLSDRLATIESSLRRAALRVDELMDLATEDEPTASLLRTESLDLVALLRGMLDAHRARNDGREFVLVTDKATLIGEWDRDRLERAFDNLLSNAVKYSRGKITVALAEEKIEGKLSTVVSVSDEGRGIPEDEIELIFKRFRRGTNAIDVPGSGLGLWSVRRIVELHGGSISATSRVGEGAVFTMRIPTRAGERRTPAGS